MNAGMPIPNDPDYLSLREAMAAVRSYFKEAFGKIRLLLALAAIGLVLGAVYKITTKKTFEAEVSFMINEETSPASGLGGVLGQFGGLLSAGNEYNLQKILELARSRRIAEEVFFDSLEIDGQTRLLANFLILEFEKEGKWPGKPFYMAKHPLEGYQFKTADPESFERLDNMALLQLHQMLQGLLETQFSEKTSIMKLVVRFGNERLSYELAHRIFKRMSLFYIDKAIEKQQETFLGLQHKTDSLRAMLQAKQYGLADIRDQYRSGFLFREDVPRVMIDQDVKMLQLVYAEAMKNKEIASFSLENRTPFIQEIDPPILPLKSLGPAWPKALVAGMIYGLLAGLIWVWGQKFYREKLAELQ